jgi:hypothetical protein
MIAATGLDAIALVGRQSSLNRDKIVERDHPF